MTAADLQEIRRWRESGPVRLPVSISPNLKEHFALHAAVLPNGFRSRPATFDDAEGVAVVYAASEAAIGQLPSTTP